MRTKNKIWLYSLIGLGIILAYGCKKGEDSNNKITDADGNVYTSITIGTQIWLKENLKTTKFCNGDLIRTTTPSTLDISGEATSNYQWAYEGNESNVATYGRLYTWYAVTDSRNVCPTGWHVPTDAEWTTLATYLGGEDVAGGKLKEAGTSRWIAPNEGATNSSGFTALPGGYRLLDGTFITIGSFGLWWSSSEYSTTYAWFRSMGYSYSNVFSSYVIRQIGYSVRCLRNN